MRFGIRKHPSNLSFSLSPRCRFYLKVKSTEKMLQSTQELLLNQYSIVGSYYKEDKLKAAWNQNKKHH